MDMAAGPDFLCIGVAKAGTGWMYDQLAARSDFWMPPIKEIRYLHLQKPNCSRAARRLQKIQQTPSKPEQSLTKTTILDTRFGEENLKSVRKEMDRDFLEQLSLLHGKPRDVKGYGQIFRSKGNFLTGDITPKYCMMDSGTFAKVIEQYPKVKIVLFLRDPVARFWSHLAMFHRKGLLEEGDLLQPSNFRKTLKRPVILETIERGLPARIARRWQKLAPSENLHIIFFDDIVSEPDKTIAELIQFLGADPSKKADLPPSFNRKAKLSKLTMPDSIKEILVNQLENELRDARDYLGGHARAWASKYGI